MHRSDDRVVVAGIPKSILNNTDLTALACMTQTFVLARKNIIPFLTNKQCYHSVSKDAVFVFFL